MTWEIWSGKDNGRLKGPVGVPSLKLTTLVEMVCRGLLCQFAPITRRQKEFQRKFKGNG